ncbi:MAG: FAD-dependent monooxygenase [Candidatus Amulumruptor caecigallinarius]|nr:FAD-dependent monooxygenase [Candidatus Amulumruptor caecigallinarius]MCM1396709.1 FAD-dependent monooxygenase [Candidatus Amulumruptor caecigallinarius]MCM1453233.1 FAD-dependent monooxygenase [bacterium]
MKQQLTLRVTPRDAASTLSLTAAASSSLGIDANRIKELRVVRRSIDARQRRVMVNITADLYIDELPEPLKRAEVSLPDVSTAPHSAIVVGAGPAGLFAALRLIELGVRPVIIERGKDVDSRRRDLAAIAREGRVDPDSNYCFGEGGAGAFSDGKLFTRSKKRGPVDEILRVLYDHGADESILIDAHPHIGTDRLPGIIASIRRAIIAAGGEVHFSTRVAELFTDSDTGAVTGVRTADGRRFDGPVILATGHSARDVYRMLHSAGIPLEPKGIAVGVRLEHPQQLIDRIRYHSPQGRGSYLPPAEYTLLTRVDGRGVYSFCMCPGGVIVPATSEQGLLVVNGMSASSRGGRWANSGMVVEVLPEDVGGEGPLAVMDYQEAIERRFFADGKATSATSTDQGTEAIPGSQNAPAQRMTDFVAGRSSRDLPATSYAPGIHPARIDTLLPDAIAHRLRRGFEEFGRKQRGFLTPEATVIGCETRTSAPVRIPRDPDTLRHISVVGLYPAGEGAGYAGGIVSAAIDGRRAAEALASTLNS